MRYKDLATDRLMVNGWCDHVAQLTQSISQLSLKPGEEEIKKKG
jgi:hypothetical protein